MRMRLLDMYAHFSIDAGLSEALDLYRETDDDNPSLPF